jgi:hypothetical protein
MGGGRQRRLEALAFELGPARALGDLAVEGIEPQRPGELLGRALEVLAAEEQAAVQLAVFGIGQVLGLRHLDAFDGARVLAALGVEVSKAQEVGGVDGVAAEALPQHLAQAAAAAVAASRLLLQLAHLRQRQLHRQVLGVETQRQQQQLGRLVMARRATHPPRQAGELVDLGRQVRRLVRGIAHACNRSPRGSGERPGV